MAVYERYGKWSRWKGSVAEIVDVVQLAEEQAHTITKSPVDTAIIQGKANASSQFESISEFQEEFVQSEVDATRTLTLKTSEKGDRSAPLTAEIVLSRDQQQPGAKLVVRGDRIEADALFAVLEERLLRGRRRMQMSQSGVAFVGLGVLILAMGAWYAVLPFIHLPEVSSAAATVLTIAFTLAGALVGGVIVGGTGLAVNWLVPQLEFVPEDGDTKWKQVRTWVVATIGAVMLGPVVTAVVVGLVSGD